MGDGAEANRYQRRCLRRRQRRQTPRRPTPPAPPPPPKPVIPPEVQSLADTFERGNYDAMQRAMMRSTDLANTIRAFRMSDSPWPDAPKKTAVFALEMALAGLRSENSFARDEGGRLLAEYHTRVRQPNGPDDFECLWFVTEAYALEGLFLPESAMIFIPRARAALPDDAPAAPRLCLRDRAAVDARQLLVGTGRRSRAPVRRRDEVAGDRSRGARARRAVPQRDGQLAARARGPCCHQSAITRSRSALLHRSRARPGPALAQPPR